MNCLLCYSKTKTKLCDNCKTNFIYDRSNGFVRRKKVGCIGDENASELRLYHLLCDIYGKSNVYRQVHPLWALSKKKVLLEYDVAVPSEKLLIEYDGAQHYIFPNYFHKTKKEFKEQRKRDRLKNKLAKKNKFKLIRFKYNDKIDSYNVWRKLNANCTLKHSV